MASLSEKIQDDIYFINVEDSNFEDKLNSNPYNIKIWKEYIKIKMEIGPLFQANLICERAVKKLPGSYKLWILLLRNYTAQTSKMCLSDPQFSAVNNAFERSLTFMHKMPQIWILYLEFLIKQKLISKIRNTFDRAIQALPITQHELIWPLYIDFINTKGVPAELGCRVYRRYTQLHPECLEDRIKYLKSVGNLDEAAVLLAQLVNDEDYAPKKGKSKEKLWENLCRLIVRNPRRIHSLNVDAIIRAALQKYPLEVGKLWTSLADYYLRLLQFEKTRDIYEEGINSVTTVRDFEFIFNTYCQFNEIMIRSKLENDQNENQNDFDIESDNAELLMARYKKLLHRRPLLLNRVLLKQNPHNVDHWLRRAEIFFKRDELLKALDVYATAIKTIDPKKCKNKLHVLWIKLAKFYEDNSDDLVNVRKTFERAVMYNFRRVDELATVWCEWVETEIRHKNYQKALEVVKLATTLPTNIAALKKRNYDQNSKAQDRVYLSTKLWSLYVDLEETLGTFDTVCNVYDTIIELKIATVNLIQNYADYLENNKYFERCFKVYEKGIALFKFPHVKPLLENYIEKFIKRYKGKKIERTREIFEDALKKMPQKESKKLYLLYGQFEEEFGTPKHAIAVYDRMCLNMQGKDQIDMYLVYISRATEMFGAIKTREIYEKAIKFLPDAYLPEMCSRFAKLEIKLGEVDRARAIFQYGAKFADTRITPNFWSAFENFEADYGNIETFADMSRIKRSVAATFTNFIVGDSLQQKQNIEKENDFKATKRTFGEIENST